MPSPFKAELRDSVFSEEHLKLQHETSFGRCSASPVLLAALLLAVVIPLAVEAVFDPGLLHQSLFDLANFVGPTTQSLLHGGGLTVCTTDLAAPDNPICFHAGRMPVATLVVAAGIRLFGNSFLYVSIFKALLLLLPIEISIFLVWKKMPASRARQFGMAALLLAPFFITLFIANIVNLQVEEDYSYSLLALALAILIFGPGAEGKDETANSGASGLSQIGYVVLFALTLDALYLSKSSMAIADLVLAIAFFLQLRNVMPRIILLVMVAAAPLGWALHQHHASGRYSFGTSFDGMNLHKGNVASFLDHYPPPPLTSLDMYDAELNRGLSFRDEWSFNDYHQHAGLVYIRTHPVQTLRGDWRKFKVVFLSLRKYGSNDSHGLKLKVETAGILIFRLILWASILGSVFTLFRRDESGLRAAAIAYLAVVAACALPYIAGFAYTRHATILIYPASLMCCRLLCVD
jgi:hypothetical protein